MTDLTSEAQQENSPATGPESPSLVAGDPTTITPVPPTPGIPPTKPHAGQILVQPKLFVPTALKDYFRFFQVPARRWWWAPIVLAIFAVTFMAILLVADVVVELVAPDIFVWDGDDLVATPGIFLYNNLLIASAIPLALLGSWIFYKQGFGWLMSVVGRMRWAWFAVASAVILLGYVVIYGFDMFVFTSPQEYFADFQIQPHTTFMIFVILLTTPLQAASEEIVDRGFLSRLLAALIPHKVVGLVVAAVVSTGFFAFQHGAEDIWLNVYYVSLGFMFWWLMYRTGGLEASIAFHIINNLFAEMELPFTDLADIFDRSEGAADASVLYFLGCQLVIVLLLDFLARRMGLVRWSAPGSALAVVVKPKRFFTRITEANTALATKKDLPRIETTFRELLPAWAYHYESEVASTVPQEVNSAGLPVMAHPTKTGLLSAERAVPWEQLPENQGADPGNTPTDQGPQESHDSSD